MLSTGENPVFKVSRWSRSRKRAAYVGQERNSHLFPFTRLENKKADFCLYLLAIFFSSSLFPFFPFSLTWHLFFLSSRLFCCCCCSSCLFTTKLPLLPLINNINLALCNCCLSFFLQEYHHPSDKDNKSRRQQGQKDWMKSYSIPSML